MNILYDSTRGGETGLTASQTILKGLAADGGLFVPRTFPKLEIPLSVLASMDYRNVAYEVMRLFLTDYTEEELRYCIAHAYDRKFDVPDICPVRKAGGMWFLELFHGKTIAFKDMALSILPHLMTAAAVKNHIDHEIVILTATSGDTGKAALEGFADVPGTSIIVFYPKDGVSPVQEKQMITQKGGNTHVIAIRGNFDDAQAGVKKIFGNESLRKEMDEAGYQFSSANSINIGRLVPQVAYYVYAYTRLLANGTLKEGEPVNFTVPTGNFGNILAAHYAEKIGVPVHLLICASNRNNVLFDFFRTGTYDRNRPFYVTTSPSMDILVSSNLERLLYEAVGNDPEQTACLMQSLSSKGSYVITEEMKARMDGFFGGYASEEDVMATIRSLYGSDGYLIDPHTAVGVSVYRNYVQETGDRTAAVLVSTASPYKFGRSVLHAVDPERFDGQSDEEQFRSLQEVTGIPMPQAIRELLDAEIRHTSVVEPQEMENAVRKRIFPDRA